jgi:hypothetical protein
MRRVFCGLALLIAFVVVAAAANVDGKWVAKMETPNGTRDVTFTFKGEGDKLTGTVSGRQGDTPIQNGKIDGDNISFTVVRNFGGNEVKSEYKGKVSGSEIKLSTTFRDQPVEMIAKKQ